VSKVSLRLTVDYQDMCSELGIEDSAFMIQPGCLVLNAAHSWRAGYLLSDFYERNQVVMDVIRRGASYSALTPPSPAGVAVVSPTKRGVLLGVKKNPIPQPRLRSHLRFGLR
jgi:hypothetical protein